MQSGSRYRGNHPEHEQRCKVVARLEPTGTGLDTAVYCNMCTMDTLLAAAEEKGISHKISSGDDSVVSAVYIKVKDGYDIDTVNTALTGKLRKVTAVKTRAMITGVSDSLAGISRTVTVMVAVIWLLAFVILLLAYVLIVRERSREFAVFRLAGASRGMLGRIALLESVICGFIGGIAGIAVAAVVLFPFSTLIENLLGLPYLFPGLATILLLAAGTIALSVAVSAFASAFTAWRLSRVDPGTALRGGN